MYRTRQPDEGSTHVLEATIVASIMVSAVAFVVSFDTPDTVTFDARESLETKTRDALAILADTEVTDSKFGKDALSAYIGECLNRKCTNLEKRLANLVPPGASYALYLSNGYDTYPVLINGTPGGETVSAARTFEPDWSSTFLATATESIGTDDALLVYALPVYRGTPVTPGGSQLLVKVSGTRADGSDYVMLAHGATVAHASAELEAIAASLYFVHPATGAVLPVYDMRDRLGQPERLTLRLAETQGGAIPEGTRLDVHLPRGWTAVAPPAANPGWTILADAQDANGAYVGSSIRARLNAPLESATLDFVFDATYHGDVLDYYPIVASLSQGATASASILLNADEHSSDPPLATPAVYLGVPSPMGRGASTTWTLAAHIPVSDTQTPEELSQIVHVRKVEIIEQEGNRIFDEDITVLPGEDMGGTWISGGDHLRWEGDVEMHLYSTLNLTFRVGASGTPGPGQGRSLFLPPVEFDEWTGRLVGSTGWGFSRQAILPENDDYSGYDPQAAALGLMHPLKSNGTYRQTTLPGSIQYNVSLVGAVQDSLYGSYVTAEDRSVPLGGEVAINANVQSLLFALAEAGQSAGVTLRFYPPWSGDERTAIYEQENLDQGLLSGEVSHIVTLDLNADGYPDPIVGTSNGRVIAYHGLTGQRLQGNTFTANLTTKTGQQQAVPKITSLSTVRYDNEDYVVVGTDVNSEGLYVLNKSFGIRWKFAFDPAGDTLALDTTTDFDADDRPEIVATRSFQTGGSRDGLTYVLRAPTSIAARELVAIPGNPAPEQDPKALRYSIGTPSAVLASRAIGPFGNAQGVLVPTQTLLDPGLALTESEPYVIQGPPSLPRAGLLAVDETGKPTSTLFGAPATVLRDYDYDATYGPARDAIVGGSSGYVVMSNGTVLTQPIFSYVVQGASRIVSADSPSSTESYALTSEGEVIMTDDAWLTNYRLVGTAPGGKAIATDGWNSFWVVGAANSVWRSEILYTPEDEAAKHYPEYTALAPVSLPAGYDWLTRLHEFRSIDFQGDRGYIAGTACAIALLCTEPIMLATQDGGETWSVLSNAGLTLYNRNMGALDKNITRVKINADTTGWIVGDGGLVARNLTASNVFVELDTPFTYDLKDIACFPGNLDDCTVVGESGAAFRSTNARSASPTWTNLTGTRGLPADRDLYSVGFPDDGRGYIGTRNMVLGSFLDSNWTALPLNYLENDAMVVSAVGDGTGFVYGGSAANGRIWLLHDYATQSQAYTKSFRDEFDPTWQIYRVELVDGNVSIGSERIDIEVTEGTEPWEPFSTITLGQGGDPRQPIYQERGWPIDATPLGRDLQFRIAFNTSGERTILSPHVRSLTFQVSYLKPGTPPTSDSKLIELDFTTTDQFDKSTSSADWNTSVRALRQPLVKEFWTRNVTGEVHDIRTGYDIVGDSHQDVWVATGDVLAENSPDHIAYAGTNLSKVVDKHDRVYLLDGRNGTPEAISPKLAGEVRQIRVAADAQGVPVTVWAATWDSSGSPTATGRLYALDPRRLDVRFFVDIGREEPTDLELGAFPASHRAAFVGAQRPADETEHTPHLWGVDETLQDDVWVVIPDDLGKYYITAPVKANWFYGPYVVEIEVEWEEGVDIYSSCQCPTAPPPPPPPGVPETPEPQTILRSARFYDHFMVTPPDSVSSPNPLYTARLLVWMRDWG